MTDLWEEVAKLRAEMQKASCAQAQVSWYYHVAYYGNGEEISGEAIYQHEHHNLCCLGEEYGHAIPQRPITSR